MSRDLGLGCLGTALLFISAGCTVPTVDVMMASPDGGLPESLDAPGVDATADPDVQDTKGLSSVDVGGSAPVDGKVVVDSSATVGPDASTATPCQCSTNQVCLGNTCVSLPNSIAAGGRHTCVLASGEVFCWGSNASGELGIPIDSTKKRTSPVAVPNLTGIKQVTAGFDFTCALTVNGKVKCWGGNAAGQLGGAGQATSSVSPVDVPGLPSIKWIAAGLDFVCAVASADNTVWCWGDNSNGQLGRTASTVPGAPAVVDKVTEANSVTAGTDFACALLSGLSSGLISCWGGNYWGQLGDGITTQDRPTPALVSGLTNAVQVVATASKSTPLSTDGPTACARLADGKVACWGDNSMGALGAPNNISSWSVQPVYVVALEGVSEIVAGAEFFCSIVASGGVGGVKCWGWNTNGQLGSPAAVLDASATPMPVMNLNSVTHLSAGTAHVCALLGSGAVYCWGENRSGQLGNGSTVDSATPVQAI